MTRTIFTLVALTAAVIALYGQSTAYRLIATNSEQWDGSLWIESDSGRYFYAQAEEDTLFYSYDWDEINMEWDYSFRRYYTFDANGNITLYLTQLWDGTLFTNYEKEERIFNAQNKLASWTRYTWDGANWVGVFRNTHTFDGQGFETAYLREKYTGGVWVNEDRNLYTYIDGYLQSYESQEWNGSTWEKVSRVVITRDAAGNALINMGQTWTGSNYENNYQYVRKFDSANNMTLDTYCDWVASNWDSVNRSSYTYNAANLTTLHLRQNWNGSSWANYSREIYSYTNALKIDTFLRQFYTSGNWVNNHMQASTYDSHDNLTHSISYMWDAGAWDPTYRSYQYFEAYTTTGINDIPVELEATVYPNPFANELHFKLAQEHFGEAEIKIFDLFGKNVLSENQLITPGQQLISINTGNLPNGGYVFVLTLDGKQSRGLITK